MGRPLREVLKALLLFRSVEKYLLKWKADRREFPRHIQKNNQFRGQLHCPSETSYSKGLQSRLSVAGFCLTALLLS